AAEPPGMGAVDPARGECRPGDDARRAAEPDLGTGIPERDPVPADVGEPVTGEARAGGRQLHAHLDLSRHRLPIRSAPAGRAGVLIPEISMHHDGSIRFTAADARVYGGLNRRSHRFRPNLPDSGVRTRVVRFFSTVD